MQEKKKKIFAHWRSKKTSSKVTDILLVAFFVAMLIPQSRMMIGGFINRVKASIINPSELPQNEQEQLNDNDYIWSLTDLDNQQQSLSKAKNKVIFINQWATWCPPCVGEMPEIQALWEKFKDNPQIEFFLISSEDIATIKNFMAKRQYTFPVYKANTSAPNKLFSNAIPVSFVISKSGKIIVKETGAVNWGGEKIETIIKKLIAE